jgi:hypothetical protein
MEEILLVFDESSYPWVLLGFVTGSWCGGQEK